VVCTDQPPAPSPQLSLPLEPEGAERVVLPAITGQQDSTASVTSIALFADCPRRYFLSRYIGWDAERHRAAARDEEEVERDDMEATEFGRHVHELLAGAAPDGAHPDALALAARFLSSDLGKQAGAAERVEREFDFLLVLEDVVLRGQIDLWFEGPGAAVIVDYKTDDVTAEDAAARARYYGLQLQLYSIAIERLTGKRPERAITYFLRADMAVPVDVGDPALSAATQIVNDFRVAQDRMEFPLREGEHCVRCPYFRGLCPAVFTGAEGPA
jgi:hypothetical protein